MFEYIISFGSGVIWLKRVKIHRGRKRGFEVTIAYFQCVGVTESGQRRTSYSCLVFKGHISGRNMIPGTRVTGSRLNFNSIFEGIIRDISIVGYEDEWVREAVGVAAH